MRPKSSKCDTVSQSGNLGLAIITLSNLASLTSLPGWASVYRHSQPSLSHPFLPLNPLPRATTYRLPLIPSPRLVPEPTFGKPDSSHSLIMPMKSMALVAMNSALKADITEFSSKAL